MLNHESSPDLLVSRVAASVRALREQQGASLSDVALRAGVAKSTLSQLEAGRANPSIETLWAIARALGVPFSRLIEPPEPDVHLLRAGDGIDVGADGDAFRSRLLVSARRRGAFELYRLELEPGAARTAEPHAAGVAEHVIVLAGRMRTGPLNQPVEVSAGDLVTFRADTPHSYEGLEPASSALVVMDYP